MKVEINADKKRYFQCSMYYMRRYFGLREIILLTLLLGIGLALFFLSGGTQIIMLILFGVSVAIILFAFVLFLWTSTSGYKVDFEMKGIAHQVLEFDEDALHVTNYDKGGKPVFMETHLYNKIDKIAIRKDVIYIYAQVSVFYYITADSLDATQRTELIELLHRHIDDESVFKIKKTYRVFPKKKKVTLEPDEKNKK